MLGEIYAKGLYGVKIDKSLAKNNFKKAIELSHDYRNEFTTQIVGMFLHIFPEEACRFNIVKPKTNNAAWQNNPIRPKATTPCTEMLRVFAVAACAAVIAYSSMN